MAAGGLCFDGGKLFETLRARWPQPDSVLAATRHFDLAPADWPALRRGCGLRALGAEFLPVAKHNPPATPDSFKWLKNGRTTFGSFVAGVRKTPRIRRPGKLGAKRP